MKIKFLSSASLLLALLLCLSSCGDKKGYNLTYDTGKSETTETVTEAPKDESITIRMVGDILLHEAVVESGYKSDGTYNYDHLFNNLKDEIEEADIALVNQEVILGGRDMGLSGYPAFNGPFEVGDALADAGFDIILHASNHAIDRGSKAVINCCNFWKTNYPEINYIGISDDNSDQNNICVKEVNGVKIAFMNYTYGTNGIKVPAELPMAVTYLDEATIRTDAKWAEENADFTVALPHWGTEYTHEADANQKRWADLFLECGVDLVIGTHPHVIQPCEVLEKDGQKMLVYYSLGNFVNSTAERGTGKGQRMIGAMADVKLEKSEDGSVHITDYGVIPLVTVMGDGLTTYRLDSYTAEMASRTSTILQDHNFTLDYCKNLINDVFGDLAE